MEAGLHNAIERESRSCPTDDSSDCCPRDPAVSPFYDPFPFPSPSPSLCPCLCLCLCLIISVCLPVCMSICMSICLPACLSVSFSCMSVCLLPVCLDCLSVGLSVYIYVSVSICLSVGLIWYVRESLVTICACTTRTRRGDYALEGISRNFATSTSCRRPPSGKNIPGIYIIFSLLAHAAASLLAGMVYGDD